MAAVQLNFALRTSGNVKTVHLVGSWDSYTGQLPLSKDPSKSGGWKSTFRFPSSSLKQGQRYWYYYVLDGYHVSHDPARDSVVEPTTGRRLNTLDIPAAQQCQSPTTTPSRQNPSTSTRRPISLSLSIPQGHPLPASSIVSPVPVKPGHQTRQVRAEQFSPLTMERLAARLASHTISSPAPPSASGSEADSEDEDGDSDSDIDSDVPSLTSSHSSASRASSPTSSVSSAGSRCSCERYGITRAGARVRIDCGGSRCGYDEDEGDEEGSCCESEDDDYEVDQRQKARACRPAAEVLTRQQRDLRRRGMVLRG